MAGAAAAVAVDVSEVRKLRKIINELRARGGLADDKTLEQLLPMVKKRIFSDGKSADSSPIGDYKPSYMSKRKRQGLGSDTKVILQFTRAMAADFKVLNGKGGFGFDDDNNVLKSEWNTKHFKKVIFALTEEEQKKASEFYGQNFKRNFK